MNNLTEQQERERGELLAKTLKLRKDREYPDRYVTEWGTKTPLGLFKTVERIVLDGE